MLEFLFSEICKFFDARRRKTGLGRGQSEVSCKWAVCMGLHERAHEA